MTCQIRWREELTMTPHEDPLLLAGVEQQAGKLQTIIEPNKANEPLSDSFREEFSLPLVGADRGRLRHQRDVDRGS